ncbi:MAG TPA: ABC transporter ATP-binding protein, partial [Actinobacteria bacterium]|nr:ABC transporter ATP-binding protein [Actinomycetes bacterium]HEX21443.1 ABC transporter ATP-binding protein [Actinomycetota bacterium]
MALFPVKGRANKNVKGTAVTAQGIWKEFRVYHEKNQSIKEIFIKRKRAEYETFWALKDVSFAVKQGITFGLIGENGSGKSTMLKILAKILRANQGTVEIKGKVSALLELGTGFHPELTGRENVFLNGSILGLSRKEISKRFNDIVAFSELEQFIDSPVKTYSSGMYVRLGFAVATNVDPDVLLIDEILAVGDEAFQRKSLDKLYELKKQKKTIIVVSHALSSIAEICDEAIWLDKGEIKAAGKARKVVATYLREVNRKEEERSDNEDEERLATPGSRRGSGELQIKSVKLLDGRGKERSIFKTG